MKKLLYAFSAIIIGLSLNSIVTAAPGTKIPIGTQTNIFTSFSSPGKPKVTPKTNNSTLKLIAGNGIQISTSPANESITITSTGLEGTLFPGGSTGQVLSKKSNDDFDYEWIFSSGSASVVTDSEDGIMPSYLFTKLNNIQNNATYNSPDIFLLNRSNHTGTQSISTILNLQSELDLKEPANSNIQLHISSLLNPHNVTKAQVGLGNVDNTSDLNKPISTAAQNALNLKSNLDSPTFLNKITTPMVETNAPDGEHYINPYNSVPFSLTPELGMIQTTSTGPLWYNGSSWVEFGGGGSGASSLSELTDWPSSISATEVGYLDGLTGNIQSQLNSISAGGIQILSSDPIIPVEGTAWINTTDNSFKVASNTGIYSYSGTFTAWDTTPVAFSFTDITDATLNTLYTSNTITVSGINYPTSISITGGEYEKNTSGTWVNTSGTVALNDTVRVRQTSSSNNSTTTNTILTIGGVSDTYSVTTVASSGDSQVLFYYNADTKGSAIVPQKGTGTVDSAPLTLTTGVVGSALQTTGSWQTMNIPTASNITLSTTWTIGFYYKYGAGFVGTVLSKNEGETAPYLHLATGNAPTFTFGYLDSYNSMDINLSADTWYFIEISGDSTSGKAAYRINGGTWSEQTGLTDGPVTTSYILFGNNNGAPSISYYDQIIFANTYKKDLYSIRNNTSF